jgi:hypothetical protein
MEPNPSKDRAMYEGDNPSFWNQCNVIVSWQLDSYPYFQASTEVLCLIQGLDNIRLLVTHGYTVLRVELEDLAESAYAEYDSFYIAGEDDKYRINVSGYSGTAGKLWIQSMVQSILIEK